MSSATKTLELLAYFSTSQPEIGLSQLCRMAKRDKATTYRHLQALEETGFVEQNPITKLYRLGPGILQLAQMRENTVPRKAGVEPALSTIAAAIGETAHVTVLSGQTVYYLASCESPKHSIRAIIDIQTFPLHATASGLCALAFGPTNLLAIAKENMTAFTANTIQSPAQLERAIQTAHETGFGQSDCNFEDGVHSLSAPLFDQTGQFAGSVSVASVATRFTPDLKIEIQQHLISASRDITRNWGGQIPASLEAIWAKSTTHSHELETAS